MCETTNLALLTNALKTIYIIRKIMKLQCKGKYQQLVGFL